MTVPSGLAGSLLMLLAPPLLPALAPQPAPAPPSFTARCASCHGEEAGGTARGPGLVLNPRVAAQSSEQLRDLLRRGNPGAGMPAFPDVAADELSTLVRYLRSINAETLLPPPPTASGPAAWGPPQPGDWRTYNGSDSANRYSPLTGITRDNVASLNVKWVYPLSHFGLETTPLAADGVLYVTGPNQVVALDARTGAALWTYARPPTAGLVDDARLGTNRGVALRGGLVFFVTDNAHLVALDRGTGALRWDTRIAPDQPPSEPVHQYGGTMAPLVVRDMVVAGVSGADAGIRGFVAAFDAETGAPKWRRFTVPRRGEPGIETWQGPEPIRGGGSTWQTGSYDAASDTIYWATGNPWPGWDGRDRPGDNLYTDCVLALDAATGEIKWHYQFTPHDVRDRDATEPNVLVDRVYRGKPSQLLLHADRNGFFYVLDRTTGAVLLAKPFLRRIDWASGIGADGRPIVTDPTGCPIDAANWSSTAYSPETGLYYVLALEECVGKPTGYPDQTGQRFLRAIDIETGEIGWEVAQPGPARAKTWSGVLATATGLLFYGQPNGGFMAVDQRDGRTLWRFPTNVRMKASPMTFALDGQQFVVVAAGPNILCFGL
jgi:PQQ-dependent dehydrogenase (methanol/ethanol family)